MMLSLVFDVFNDGLFFFDVVSKSAISILPTFELRKQPSALHPVAASLFDVFDIIGKREGGMQVRKNLNVVFNATNAIQFAMPFFDYSPDVFVKFLHMCF